MTIYTFRFQPFVRRAGQGDVIGLRFTYNVAVVATLKASLARYRDRARDPAAHVLTAGGWLAQARCWFVEPFVWPLVCADLAGIGASCTEIGRPGDVPHYERQAPPVWDVVEDDDADDTLPSVDQLDALASVCADVLSAPVHELGGDVLVRVPSATWQRFGDEARALIAWKVWHQDRELLAKYEAAS